MDRFKALIFDCDGVLAETERDGHRIAFNQAFRANGLDIEWDVAEYGELLKTGGGKERLRAWFEAHPERRPADWQAGWPDDALISRLHADKTRLFVALAAAGGMPPRPGIVRLFDEAVAAGLILCVCSTSQADSVKALIGSIMGEARLARFNAIFAGDAVRAKKPAPDIYQLVTERFGILPEACLVVEDSGIGLQAAKAAGMHCLVTVSGYTRDEDFTAADAVVSSLGDPDGEPVNFLKWPAGCNPASRASWLGLGDLACLKDA